MDGMLISRVPDANANAASEMAKRLFAENRRLKAELNRLRALHEAETADIEITHGRTFRLIEPEWLRKEFLC